MDDAFGEEETAANSASWPGVRMVTLTAWPRTRFRAVLPRPFVFESVSFVAIPAKNFHGLFRFLGDARRHWPRVVLVKPTGFLGQRRGGFSSRQSYRDCASSINA